MKNLEFPVSTDILIPQKASMRFVHFATALEDNSFSTVSDTSGNIFRLKDGIDPIAGIEFMAQSCAALNGYRNRAEGGEEKIGFLAGITEFNFPEYPVSGDSLEVIVNEDNVIPPFTLVSGVLCNDEGEAGNGRMKVYEVEDMDQESSLHNGPTLSSESGNSFVHTVESSDYIDKYCEYAGDVSSLETELLSALVMRDETFNASFAADFTGFHGHFPENPVFPGVMMIKLLQLILSLQNGSLVRLKKISRIKFGNIILPRQEFRFELKDLAEKRGKFSILSGETVCASGNWEAWD